MTMRSRAPMWTNVTTPLFAGSFRVSLFIELRCPWNLGKRSGCFMIIRWNISWFVYQRRHFATSPRHFLFISSEKVLIPVQGFNHGWTQIRTTNIRIRLLRSQIQRMTQTTSTWNWMILTLQDIKINFQIDHIYHF